MKRQRGGEEMKRQSRTDERRDNGNISSLITFELRISRKSKRKTEEGRIGKENERDLGGRTNLGQSRGKETRGGAELGGVVEVQKFDKCNYNYNYNYSYKSVEDCFVWELEEMTVTLVCQPLDFFAI